MRKTVCFLSIRVIFASCYNANKNNGSENMETNSAERIVGKMDDILYANCPLANLTSNNEIYFYNTGQDSKP